MDSNGNYDLLTNVDAFNNLNLSPNDNSSLVRSHEKYETSHEMETFESYSLETLFENNNELQDNSSLVLSHEKDETSHEMESFESYSLDTLFENNNELQSSNLVIEQEQVPGPSSALFNVTIREHESLITLNKKQEIKKLLKKLREKYSGEAQNSSCFPQNPLAIDNARYIEFNCPAIEGRIGIVDWCKCHECIPMSTNVESICCQEVENAVKYMSNINCISQHEFFSIFCNRVETVNITQQIIGDVRRPPPRKENNRLLRKTAYRAFTGWVHGYLGLGNRRPIPSCAVKKVREAFPDPDSEYMGYISSSDSPAEFMAFE